MPPLSAAGAGLRWAAVEVDGRPLRYRESVATPRRDGPPVVLVHGLLVSGRYMVPTASALAGEVRVLVPDLPGFGRSPGPRRPLAVPGLAAALGSWLEALALPPALLLGNSFGCQVVAELAAAAPAAAAAVMLVGPTVDPAARGLLSQAARLAIDILREPPSLLGIQVLATLRAGPRRAVGTTAAMLRHRVEAVLPRVAVPGVVVRGGRDPICPRAWAGRAAALLPAGRLATVPGAPHAVNYAAPRRLASLVLELAAEVGAPTG